DQAGERRRIDRARERWRARRAVAAGARGSRAQPRRSTGQRQGTADAAADVRLLQVDPQRPELLGKGRDLLLAALERVVHAQLLPELLREVRAARAGSARGCARGERQTEARLMSTGAVLDPAVIDTLRQLTAPGEPDVLTEVLKLFLEEVPARMARLRNAWTAGNIEELHRAAHSL